MKKALSLILTVCFVLSAFCGTVLAGTENLQKLGGQMPKGGFLAEDSICLGTVYEKSGTKGLLRGSETPEPDKDIEEFLKEEMEARTYPIQIFPEYKIPVPNENGQDDVSEFHRTVRMVLFNNYHIFVYDTVRYRTVTDGSGNRYLYDFYPSYYTPEEGDELARANMLNTIDEYLDAVSDIPNDDVVGKLAVIHDLLCENVTYDHDGLDNEINNGILCNYARTAYNAFTNNLAVCQGYAIALKAIYDALNEELMQERGTNENIIETSFCSSDNVAHIWNVVKVNGQWYHIDATWDDYDSAGNVGHNFFMRDDSYFTEDSEYHPAHLAFDGNSQPINDWVFYTDDEDIVCSDDTYSQGYIFNIEYTYDLSYSDGKYNVDFGDVYCFRTDSIILLTKVLATDSFLYEYKASEEDEGVMYNAVLYFTQQPTEIMQISASFDENGALMANRCKIYEPKTIGNVYDFTMLFYTNRSPSRVFIWSPDNWEPLCRAIDLPAAVN